MTLLEADRLLPSARRVVEQTRAEHGDRIAALVERFIADGPNDANSTTCDWCGDRLDGGRHGAHSARNFCSLAHQRCWWRLWKINQKRATSMPSGARRGTQDWLSRRHLKMPALPSDSFDLRITPTRDEYLSAVDPMSRVLSDPKDGLESKDTH